MLVEDCKKIEKGRKNMGNYIKKSGKMDKNCIITNCF